MFVFMYLHAYAFFVFSPEKNKDQKG